MTRIAKHLAFTGRSDHVTTCGREIGEGLFANRLIYNGKRIVRAHGIQLTAAAHPAALALARERGYALQGHGSVYTLDCYAHRHSNPPKCLLSFSNDPRGLVHRDDQVPARANAFLDYIDGEFWLFALSDIQPGEEILWDYGPSYVFPRTESKLTWPLSPVRAR